MWELHHKETWMLKNWSFWSVVLKTLENHLDCKEIIPVNPKGNQSWIFIGRTDAEAETPILCKATWRKELTLWEIPWFWKDWRQEEKGTTEDELVGQYHWLDGHKFEQFLGIVDELGSLVCCSPWGRKELHKTEQLNWAEMVLLFVVFFLMCSYPRVQYWTSSLFNNYLCSLLCEMPPQDSGSFFFLILSMFLFCLGAPYIFCKQSVDDCCYNHLSQFMTWFLNSIWYIFMKRKDYYSLTQGKLLFLT